MTLQEFRKLLLGCEKSAEISFQTPDGQFYSEIAVRTNGITQVTVKLSKETHHERNEQKAKA